jgi:hypothetical protein
MYFLYNFSAGYRRIIKFLQTSGLEILEWPARSPDLSPLEHVWDDIGRTLQRLRQPSAALD